MPERKLVYLYARIRTQGQAPCVLKQFRCSIAIAGGLLKLPIPFELAKFCNKKKAIKWPYSMIGFGFNVEYHHLKNGSLRVPFPVPTRLSSTLLLPRNGQQTPAKPINFDRFFCT